MVTLNTVVLAIIPVLVLILGPLLASFFAVIVMRQNDLTSVRSTRSACDKCGHLLNVFDLVPILSFLVRRGRCRYCHEKIAKRVWLVEIYGLVVYAILGLGVWEFGAHTGDMVELVFFVIFGLVMVSLLFYLAIFDVFTFTIPVRFTQLTSLVAILANILVLVTRMFDPLALENINLGRIDNLVAGVVFALFFQIIIWLTKQKAMGSGDVYIALIIGLSLGWPGTLSAFYVMIFSAVICGLIYATWQRRYKGTLIPLVPFLTLGFVVALVWGYNIFNFLFWQL